MIPRSIVVPSLLISIAIAACGDGPGANDPTHPHPGAENAQSPNRTGPFEAAASDPPPQTDTRDGSAPQPTVVVPPPAAAVETLGDAHVIEVIRTANNGEIEQARLAATKAKDARAKKLAAMMLKDHGEANTKADAIAKKLALEPRPSTLRDSLDADAKKATAAMDALSGAAFDKAYVDAQVAEHQAVVDAIESKLLPSAQAPEVRAFLEEVRTKVAHHLGEAKAVRASMK